LSSKDPSFEAPLVFQATHFSRGGGRDTRLAQYNALPGTAKQARQSSDARTMDTELSVTSQDLPKAASRGGKKFVFQPLPESFFENKVSLSLFLLTQVAQAIHGDF